MNYKDKTTEELKQMLSNLKKELYIRRITKIQKAIAKNPHNLSYMNSTLFIIVEKMLRTEFVGDKQQQLIESYLDECETIFNIKE